MLIDFLSPVNPDSILSRKLMPVNQFGKNLSYYESDLPDLKSTDIAFIGLQADHESTGDNGCAAAPDAVRKSLYQLYNWHADLNVADLGNIKQGSSQEDTMQALKAVVEHLLKHKVLPIIVGGTHDFTYGQFTAYDEIGAMINALIIDEQIDLYDRENGLNSDSFLYSMLEYEPNFISDFGIAGYQRFLTDPTMVDTLRKLNFDCHRLGMFRNKMTEFEPIVRNTHLLSIDVSAIAQADAPGVENGSPNGFKSDEICSICRYAGMADRLSSLGIYQYNPWYDRDEQTAKLIAQMIWYFIDGYYSRKNEFPEFDDENCVQYTVEFPEENYQLIFVKSKMSDRWWMKMPEDHASGPVLIPCSYSDYVRACRRDIPERWLNAYARLS